MYFIGEEKKCQCHYTSQYREGARLPLLGPATFWFWAGEVA